MILLAHSEGLSNDTLSDKGEKAYSMILLAVSEGLSYDSVSGQRSLVHFTLSVRQRTIQCFC